MRRLLLGLPVLLGLCAAPANAFELLSLPITTASGPLTSPNFQLRASSGGQETTNIVVQCTFTYGSGGTSVDAWVQTSVDGGSTWIDVVHCGQFLLASSRLVFNMTTATPHTAGVVPTDGTLATANTANDGIIGSQWRVKYVTVGTYVATTLRIDANASGLAVFP